MILTQRLHTLFRIACAMCFIGHGAFGIITKQVWCNYFAVFGIGEAMAYKLMPLIGIADIFFGILFIVYPIRSVARWLVFWGLFTALLRPLAGEPFAEFLERAGNWGAPLILLFLSAPGRGVLKPRELSEEEFKKVLLWMRVIASTLLIGHGWLNLIEKGGLLKQYASIGIGDTILTSHIIGAIEIAGALMILFKPVRELIFILFLWKMISEVLYPAYPVFEWIERGGSYAILLGLWFATRRSSLPIIAAASIAVLSSCSGNNNLSNDDIATIFKEKNVYPRTVEGKVFCNDETVAKQIQDTNLDDEGYLTVQLTHTKDDIGQSLIHFTEKAKPYLIQKADSVESIEIQLVKMADETFAKVDDVLYSNKGNTAIVDYTVNVDNVSPFAILLPKQLTKTQSYRTSFIRTDEGWEWDGKMIPINH